MGAINNWGYNITEYVKLLQEYPIKLVSLILDLAIVIFVLIKLLKIAKYFNTKDSKFGRNRRR